MYPVGVIAQACLTCMKVWASCRLSACCRSSSCRLRTSSRIRSWSALMPSCSWIVFAWNQDMSLVS